jgi:hypothetical protein
MKHQSEFLPPPKPPKAPEICSLENLITPIYAEAAEDTRQRGRLSAEDWNFGHAVNGLAKFKKDARAKSEEQLVDEFVSNEDALGNFDKLSRQQSVLARLRAGYILKALRQKAPHGTWEKLIRQKVPGLARATINRYIRAAEAYPDPRRIPSGLTTSDLYRRAKILPKADKAGSVEGKTMDSKSVDARELEKTVTHLQKLAVAFRAKGSVAYVPANSKARLAAKIRVLSVQLQAIADELEGKVATAPLPTCSARTSPVPTCAVPLRSGANKPEAELSPVPDASICRTSGPVVDISRGESNVAAATHDGHTAAAMYGCPPPPPPAADPEAVSTPASAPPAPPPPPPPPMNAGIVQGNVSL